MSIENQVANLHPVRALAELYPDAYRFRMLPSGATVIEGRPDSWRCDPDEFDYATDADELIAVEDELAFRRAEYARDKATARAELEAGYLNLAIACTRDALSLVTRIKHLERAVDRLTRRIRSAAP